MEERLLTGEGENWSAAEEIARDPRSGRRRD